MAASVVARARLWHFECPECGFGDREHGRLIEMHEVHCEICLGEDRVIRLRIWPAEDGARHGRAEPEAAATQADRRR